MPPSASARPPAQTTQRVPNCSSRPSLAGGDGRTGGTEVGAERGGGGGGGIGTRCAAGSDAPGNSAPEAGRGGGGDGGSSAAAVVAAATPSAPGPAGASLPSGSFRAES